MTEYIEREQARQVICGWCEYDTCPGYDNYWDKCDAKRRLNDIPTADVKPVVRGEWRLYSPLTDAYECNNCGYQVIDESFRTNFCPNCGADMRPEYGVEMGTDDDQSRPHKSHDG